MKEYIDKEKAMKILTDSMYAYGTFSVERSIYMTARQKIKNIQAEDVAPVVHGKWIGTFPILGAGDFAFRCSKCWCVRHEENATYCPNCGAKMNLED